MTLVAIEPVVNVVSASITFIIASILCAILLVLHCYKYYKHEISSESTSSINKLSKSKKSFVHKLMFILTILHMTLVTISFLTAPIAYYVCNKRFRQFVDMGYHLSKGILYLVLILRLHLVFQNSKYKYKLKTLILWATFVIITFSASNILGWFVATFVQKDEIILFGENIIVCINLHPETSLNYYVGLAVASIDILMAITIPIAFVYPLTKIMKSLKQDYDINQHVHSDQELKKPIIKSTILTIIIVIVSLLAYSIFAAFRFVAIWSIPAVLECLCIILITPYHDKLYKRLCCGILVCISLVQMKHDEMEKVPVTINKNHNQTDDNDIMSKDVEETLYDTQTLATLPQENIKYENQSEYTQTAQIEMYSTQ